MRAAAVTALLVLSACADTAPDTGSEAPATPDAIVGTVEATDDGALDAGFAAFRDSLRAVVARRDTAGLLAVVAPDARLSFGDTPGGPDGLRQMWLAGAPPDEAHGATVWQVLTKLLDGGSVDEDGAVTVPAVAALWPDTLDAFSHVAVAGENVPVQASATDTTVVARVSRIYLAVEGPAEAGWWRVRLPDGRAGAVPTTATTSPVGYRASFWDDGDGWQLRSFLYGD